MSVDLEKCRQKFLESLDVFVATPEMIEMPIFGDDKYILRRTKYRIEIRSNESSTWLTYVVLPSGGDTVYRDELAEKYLELVKVSNPEHFDKD